jgi:hypothetical protein
MDLRTDDGPVTFYRSYVRTDLHAVATVALTALGTLTVVHRGFAAAALAAYLLPPLALYARGAWLSDAGDEAARGRASGDRTDAGQEPAAEPAGSRRAAAEPDDDLAPSDPGWTTARPPTNVALHDVTVAGETAVAVGDDGIALARGPDGEWAVSLSDGPGASGATLTGVAATSDGEAVWVAGDSGAVGRRDGAGRWVDHSAPGDDTSNLAGVAVVGPAGTETVLLVDGSGRVRRGRYRDGELAWSEPRTPGSGSSIAGVALGADGTGYLVDTAGAAFETSDGGRSWRSLGLDADGTPTAVVATGDGPAVATTAGRVHLHDGRRWTPERVADGALPALAWGSDLALAAGDGAVHEREGPGDWQRVVVPASGPLRGVAVGAPGAVCVGAGGCVLERPAGGAD